MTIEENLARLTDLVKCHVEKDHKGEWMETSENNKYASKGVAGSGLGLGM